jgi:hypothetical protein
MSEISISARVIAVFMMRFDIEFGASGEFLSAFRR